MQKIFISSRSSCSLLPHPAPQSSHTMKSCWHVAGEKNRQPKHQRHKESVSLSLPEEPHGLQRNKRRIKQATEKHLPTLPSAKPHPLFRGPSAKWVFNQLPGRIQTELTSPFSSAVSGNSGAAVLSSQSYAQLSNHFSDERKKSPPQKLSSFFSSLA